MGEPLVCVLVVHPGRVDNGHLFKEGTERFTQATKLYSRVICVSVIAQHM